MNIPDPPRVPPLTFIRTRIKKQEVSSVPISGARAVVGGATMDCPECGALISTEHADWSEQIAGGLRFVGVPCTSCHKRFTVELTEADTPCL